MHGCQNHSRMNRQASRNGQWTGDAARRRTRATKTRRRRAGDGAACAIPTRTGARARCASLWLEAAKACSSSGCSQLPRLLPRCPGCRLRHLRGANKIVTQPAPSIRPKATAISAPAQSRTRRTARMQSSRLSCRSSSAEAEMATRSSARGRSAVKFARMAIHASQWFFPAWCEMSCSAG